MPRSGSLGTYSLPGAQANQQPNTPIPSAVNNQGWSDIEQTFNTPTPIAYGGTGAETPGAGADNLSPAFVNVTSASTTNIGAASSPNVNITGTTTITAFDTAAAGIKRFVKFAAALTLTHNGTSLILPGAADIVTVAGDTAIFISEGSGNWRCMALQRFDENPYVEGTFTPTLTFGGNSVGMTWGDRHAHYRRVGSLVTVQIYGRLTARGSSTGDARIGGLPFTSIDYYQAAYCGYGRNFAGLVAGMTGYVIPGTVTIAVENNTISGTTAATHNNFTDTSQFIFGASYMCM